MTVSNLIDSSVWIAYLFEGRYKKVIEIEKTDYLSVISLFEIKRKLEQRELSPELIKEKIEYIKKRALIIPVDEIIAEKAATISLEHNLAASDSIIYATALINKAELLTLDNDFRGLMNAKVLDAESENRK